MPDKLEQNKGWVAHHLTVYENSDSPLPASGAPPLVPFAKHSTRLSAWTKPPHLCIGVGASQTELREVLYDSKVLGSELSRRFRGRDIGFAHFLLKAQFKIQRGQTLVELMVAMSVVTIGLLGVFAVLSQSLGLNRIIANQYTASALAAEGIEVVKNIADSNVVAGSPWNEGLSVDGGFGVQYSSPAPERGLADRKLKFDPASGIYSYDSGNETGFKRVITLMSVSANEIRVNSKVEWTDRGGQEFSIDLEDRLFNWH